jgi:hypothetical protein
MIQKLKVHHFKMGDVDDPEIYAAQPLYEWEKSEVGQWIMEHAVDQPEFHITKSYELWGYLVVVTANLNSEDATYFSLKWGSCLQGRT